MSDENNWYETVIPLIYKVNVTIDQNKILVFLNDELVSSENFSGNDLDYIYRWFLFVKENFYSLIHIEEKLNILVKNKDLFIEDDIAPLLHFLTDNSYSIGVLYLISKTMCDELEKITSPSPEYNNTIKIANFLLNSEEITREKIIDFLSD